MNNGSVLFKCRSGPACTRTRTLKLKQLNGIQPSFIFILFNFAKKCPP